MITIDDLLIDLAADLTDLSRRSRFVAHSDTRRVGQASGLGGLGFAATWEFENPQPIMVPQRSVARMGKLSLEAFRFALGRECRVTEQSTEDALHLHQLRPTRDELGSVGGVVGVGYLVAQLG
jgi:hypothetical protein